MRTTIDLPDQTFRRAKALAALRGMKLKDLITGFVERGLTEIDAETAPVKRKLPDFVREPTGVTIPALTNEEIDAIWMDEIVKE